MTCPSCDTQNIEIIDCDECYEEICLECANHPLAEDGLSDEDINLCLSCEDDYRRKNPEVYQRETRLAHYL